MSWKASRERAESAGAFLSLNADGDTAVFLPLTEPETVEKDGFTKGTTRIVERVLTLTVPVKEDSHVRMLDLGLYAFLAYDGLVGDGHEMTDLVKIIRHGAKGDTATRYTFVVGKEITDAQKKIAQAILKEWKKAESDAANVPF